MSSDSLDVTPEMACRDALARIQEQQPSKAFIVLLWDDDGKFDTGFHNAGLSLSQAVALLEVQKLRLIQLMDTTK